MGLRLVLGKGPAAGMGAVEALGFRHPCGRIPFDSFRFSSVLNVSILTLFCVNCKAQKKNEGRTNEEQTGNKQRTKEEQTENKKRTKKERGSMQEGVRVSVYITVHTAVRTAPHADAALGRWMQGNGFDFFRDRESLDGGWWHSINGGGAAP
jgi:hypothetical protein